MKFYRWNKHYLGWGITAFIVIVSSILFFMMLSNLEGIGKAAGNFIGAINPILYGFIFAYLLAPVVEFFEKRVFSKAFTKFDLTYKDVVDLNKKKGTHVEDEKEVKFAHLKRYIKNKPRRIVSITCTFVIFLGIITGMLIAIIPQLVITLQDLVKDIPEYIKSLTEWINNSFEEYPDIRAEIINIINDGGTALKNLLTENILPQMGDYLGFLTNGIMSVISLIMNIMFGLVVAIYCLYSKELFAAQAKKVLYTVFSVKHANKMITSVRKVHRSFGNFITGTIIDSFVVGCITFIAATIAGIPDAVLVAVIMGLTNIIPVFGPFIGIVPALLLIFMKTASLVPCIVFTIIVIIIQNLNGNVISPKILGGSTGLTSFWVIFAILVGQGLFGFWGLIIGIPIFAVLYSAMRTFFSDKLEEKGLPPGSDHYTDINTINESDLVPVSLSETIAAENEIKEKEEREKKELQKQKSAKKREAIKSRIKKITGKGKKTGKR